MKPAQLRKLCKDWPGVTADIKWGADLVMSVAGKMFAAMPDDPKHPLQISFKVPDEQFLALTELPGIIPAPYLARVKWVQVRDDQRYGDAWLAARLRESYELVAAKLSKKLRKELGIA